MSPDRGRLSAMPTPACSLDQEHRDEEVAAVKVEMRGDRREVNCCGPAAAVAVEEEKTGGGVIDDAVAGIGRSTADMELRRVQGADRADGVEGVLAEDDPIDMHGEVTDHVDVAGLI